MQPDREPDLIAAGDFDTWLTAMAAALTGEEAPAPMTVPCGSCTACCRGGYFIEIRPTDTHAAAAIDPDLLFPAPGAPPGYRLLAQERSGHCPLLSDDGCRIYPCRPLACRTYDCRIFAATGLTDADPRRADIMARAARWRFEYRSAAARRRHRWLVAGARWLQEHGTELAVDLPVDRTQLAMLAVSLHRVFFELGDMLGASKDSDAGVRCCQRLSLALQDFRAG